MVGDQAFFQIAVGLIPVLLFGGFLFNRRDAPDRSKPFQPTDGFALLAIAVLGFLAIIAEAIAIGGAVGAEPKTQGKVLVIAVILLGMLLVVLGGLLPRALHMLSHVPKPHSGSARFALGALLLVLAATAVFSAIQVNKAVQIGQSEANVREAERLQGQIEATRHREESRRRRINNLFFEWERIPYALGQNTTLARIHLREVREEIKAEERAEREDLDHIFELERRIGRLGV